MTKPRSRYYHRHDHARGKDVLIANKKASDKNAPRRKESPETWLDTVETAFAHDIGCVLDSLQVRALRRDYNDLIQMLLKVK